MAATNLTKEITRFTLQSKKECLEDLLKAVPENVNSPYYTHTMSQLNRINDELNNVSGKRVRSDKPRKLSAYNKFIQKTLPVIARDFPSMGNKARMEKASSIWKQLSTEQKEAYNST